MSVAWLGDDQLVSEAEMELQDFHISGNVVMGDLDPMDTFLAKMGHDAVPDDPFFPNHEDGVGEMFPFSSTTLEPETCEVESHTAAGSHVLLDGSMPYTESQNESRHGSHHGSYNGRVHSASTETESANSEMRKRISPTTPSPSLSRRGKAKSVVCLQSLDKIEKVPSYSNLQKLAPLRKVQSVGSLTSRSSFEQLSPRAARARTMERLKDKRSRRTYAKVVRYDVRQKIASNRPRVHGRFVKVNDAPFEE